MTLQNGFNSAQGGAIYILPSASVVLKNCTLLHNKAYAGAAIFNSRGTLQIDGSSFGFNAAASSGSSIHATGATLNISSSLFMNETNTAVYAEASTVAIVNSTFSQNSATFGAGLACFKGTIAAVSRCFFDSNEASSEAGAISVVTQSQLIASDTVFSSNTAGVASGAIGTFDDSSAELTHCQFLNNSAQGGGALTVYQGTSLSLNGCTFEGNTASIDGGAMTIGTQQCTIANTSFSYNTAQSSGGAIRVDSGCNSTLINTTYSHNTATGGLGGAINTLSDTYISGCVFDNNTAATGGAVRYGPSGVVIVNDTVYTNNAATNTGGAMQSSTKAVAA
eukprot:2860-Heterococcus_DN1.PRE.1